MAVRNGTVTIFLKVTKEDPVTVMQSGPESGKSKADSGDEQRVSNIYTV